MARGGRVGSKSGHVVVKRGAGGKIMGSVKQNNRQYKIQGFDKTNTHIGIMGKTGPVRSLHAGMGMGNYARTLTRSQAAGMLVNARNAGAKITKKKFSFGKG